MGLFKCKMVGCGLLKFFEYLRLLLLSLNKVDRGIGALVLGCSDLRKWPWQSRHCVEDFGHGQSWDLELDLGSWFLGLLKFWTLGGSWTWYLQPYNLLEDLILPQSSALQSANGKWRRIGLKLTSEIEFETSTATSSLLSELCRDIMKSHVMQKFQKLLILIQDNFSFYLLIIQLFSQ